MPITTQCQLLGLSRSSLYYRTREVSACDLTLMRRLDELHLEHPFLGSRKLTRLLKGEGHAIGRRHVVTLMRDAHAELHQVRSEAAARVGEIGKFSGRKDPRSTNRSVQDAPHAR